MAGHKLIKTQNEKGEEVTLVVRTPNAKQLRDAQLASVKAFKEACDNKAYLRANLDEVMREQGLWNDNKEKELKELNKNINDGERKLAKGGAGGFKKNEAKELAINMKRWRARQVDLLSSRRSLDEYTAEGQAENTRFDYLVSVCVFNEDEQQTFNGLEDYRNRSTEQYAIIAATTLATMLYNFDDKYDHNLPENKFLRTYKFTDEKNRLINKDGHLVDETGKLVNEEGRYVNEKEELVDINGNKVDKDGNPIEEFVPFDED